MHRYLDDYNQLRAQWIMSADLLHQNSSRAEIKMGQAFDLDLGMKDVD